MGQFPQDGENGQSSEIPIALFPLALTDGAMGKFEFVQHDHLSAYNHHHHHNVASLHEDKQKRVNVEIKAI